MRGKCIRNFISKGKSKRCQSRNPPTSPLRISFSASSKRQSRKESSSLAGGDSFGGRRSKGCGRRSHEIGEVGEAIVEPVPSLDSINGEIVQLASIVTSFVLYISKVSFAFLRFITSTVSVAWPRSIDVPSKLKPLMLKQYNWHPFALELEQLRLWQSSDDRDFSSPVTEEDAHPRNANEPPNWKALVNRKFFLDSYEVGELCYAAEQIFMHAPIVLQLKAPIKVFGDLHGQFGDLMRLCDEYGFPSTAGDIT
nr:Serine/threonine-protein phosphatase BSL1 [Ipomoea batatas]